jgi:DNA-binding MarR family transcriptional regulator
VTNRASTTLEPQKTEQEAAARLRSAIARISRHLRPTKAGAGYTPTQISVLQTVAKQGPIRLSDLAAAEGLNPTMLSRIARKLEDQVLIRRHPHPVDRRAALLEVTAAGRKLFERIRTERTDQLSLELDRLTETEHRLVLDALPVLERLAERLKDRPR